MKKTVGTTRANSLGEAVRRTSIYSDPTYLIYQDYDYDGLVAEELDEDGKTIAEIRRVAPGKVPGMTKVEVHKVGFGMLETGVPDAVALALMACLDNLDFTVEEDPDGEKALWVSEEKSVPEGYVELIRIAGIGTFAYPEKKVW